MRAAPWQTADLAALGLTEAQCRQSVRWVGTDGSHAAAELAIARALQVEGWPWKVVGSAVLGTRPVSGKVYRWIAEHRSSLPGGTPACAPHPPV